MTNENKSPNKFEMFVIALAVACLPGAVSWWIWPEGILDRRLSEITLRQLLDLIGSGIFALMAAAMFSSIVKS